MTKNIVTVKSAKKNLTWVNIVNAQKDEIDYLRRKFKFNDLDLEDSYAKAYSQRPKFNLRSNYCFLILQFPVYDRMTKSIKPEEIDFFISKNQIITIHNSKLKPLAELFNLCASDEFYRSQYLNDNNAALLYEIIIRLQEYCYPLLDRLSIDIKSIERNIFAGYERRMVTEILYVKRNLLNFRKIMEAHRNVILKISRDKVKFLPVNKLKIYYNELLEHTKNIWEILEGQKEMIEAIENTNTTLVSFKLNDVMRILTIFSVIVFPLTLVAAIFGMNTTDSMPFVNNPYGFWIIMAIMLVATFFMFLFFKKKKWL